MMYEIGNPSTKVIFGIEGALQTGFLPFVKKRQPADTSVDKITPGFGF